MKITNAVIFAGALGSALAADPPADSVSVKCAVKCKDSYECYKACTNPSAALLQADPPADPPADPVAVKCVDKCKDSYECYKACTNPSAALLQADPPADPPADPVAVKCVDKCKDSYECYKACTNPSAALLQAEPSVADYLQRGDAVVDYLKSIKAPEFAQPSEVGTGSFGQRLVSFSTAVSKATTVVQNAQIDINSGMQGYLRMVKIASSTMSRPGGAASAKIALDAATKSQAGKVAAAKLKIEQVQHSLEDLQGQSSKLIEDARWAVAEEYKSFDAKKDQLRAHARNMKPVSTAALAYVENVQIPELQKKVDKEVGQLNAAMAELKSFAKKTAKVVGEFDELSLLIAETAH